MRILPILVLSAMAACVLALPSQAGNPLPGLPNGWSHATFNVVIRHQPHTLTYDRGRVTAVGANSLTLHEGDGTVVTITVAPNAKIVIAGRPATLAQVRRLEVATTMSIDAAPASTVRVRIPAALARQAARR